jgi:hypothetical protein
MTPADVQEEMKGSLRLKTVSGRYSSGLVGELAAHYVNRTLHVHKVLDEIGVLEGAPGARPSNAKRATVFRGPILRGLSHKHVTQPADIFENVTNHWKDQVRLETAVRAVPVDQLAHHLIMEGYSARAGNAVPGDPPLLTGEWSIVFVEHDGRNYYLTLGLHKDDASIWRRCRACSSQFPELAILRENRTP